MMFWYPPFSGEHGGVWCHGTHRRVTGNAPVGLTHGARARLTRPEDGPAGAQIIGRSGSVDPRAWIFRSDPPSRPKAQNS